MNEPKTSSALLVFLFTDLVDSTGWKQSLGDTAYAADILRPHNDLFRRLLAEFPDAVERNFTGDGFLATFPSPSAAVQFALTVHERLQEHTWSAAVAKTGRRPETRIGIHLGEAIAYADTDPQRSQITGQAVDLAARIMGLAAGKQTLLTRHAFDSARQYVREENLSWLAHGQYRCKGSDDPLEVCEVGVQGHAPLAPPADSDKAKRIKIDADDDTGSWRPAAGLPIPRRDGWIIEKKLGEGGFGEVWLARHQRTRERRVFKFCFDAERLRSFKRELTFFKLIKNELGERPDIAKLHEVQVEAPPYFLESEFVESGNLSDWAAAQGGLEKISLATRLRLMVETARAVAAAHSLGIIHKDLKPSNILIKLDRDGQPHAQLNDFGIGILSDRTLLQKGAITETGFTESVMFGNDSSRTGTRLYSPPEANLGKPATTGFDVYALGVMLFQMVVGDLHLPLGTGWQEAVSSPLAPREDYSRADDALQAELLLEDITLATHGEPAKRLPGAALFAEHLANLDARRAERLAEIARQETERLAWRSRRKYVLRAGAVVTVLVIMTLAGLGVYAAKKIVDAHEQQTKKEVQQSLRRTAHIASQLFADKLQDRVQFVQHSAKQAAKEKWLTTLPATLDKIRRNPGRADEALSQEDRQPLNEWLVHRSKLMPWQMTPGASQNMVMFGVVDRRGYILAMANDGKPFELSRDPNSIRVFRSNFAWHEYFNGTKTYFEEEGTDVPHEPINHCHISQVFRSRTSDRWQISVSAPIFDDKNEVIALVATSVDVQHDLLVALNDSRSESDLMDNHDNAGNPSEDIILINDRGSWAWHPRAAFKQFEKKDPDPVYNHKKQQWLYEKGSGIGTFDDPFPKEADKPKYLAGFAELFPHRGGDDLLLAGKRWIVIAQKSEETTAAPLQEMRHSLYRIGLVALILLGGLAIALWLWLIRTLARQEPMVTG